MKKINDPNKKRILIIDDNIQIHQDFKKVLLISKEKEHDLDKLEEALFGKTSDQQDETYSIDYASQGEEGLKMVEESIRKNEPYAVAFIDVRMPPGWDGIETISKIWEICPELQIVICTAYSDYSWQELFSKFGHTDKLLILKKPFDNIEVRQLTYTLSKKWELNRIANLKLNELEKNVEERTKELKLSEEKYRTMVEFSNDMIWTLDTKGNFLYINKKSEEVAGRSKKSGLGKSFAPVIVEEDLKMVEKVFMETLKGKSLHYEVRIHDSTRTKIITLSVNTTPIKKDGKVIGTVSFGRDITERKRAEEEINTSRERLKMLNKIIRHDLSNDFVVIQSAVNIFKRTSDVSLLDEINKRVAKSLSTIASYRKYESFIDSNTGLDEVEISDLMNNLIVEYPKIKFNIEGKGKVFADDALYSVFNNLITNSIKHGEASQIDIIISSENDTYKIKFMDNGKGIPDKIKDRIFDEGFSYGKSSHTGIGLHIVKKTIEQYGGFIFVEKNNSNGAVFVISLRKVIGR
ncbi:MAG: PAS domain S-box protein [Candidatus Cloacimonadales bacterium]|nr:PAS domain S-box protein [Candidatus Cloacimonadales bacterium]